MEQKPPKSNEEYTIGCVTFPKTKEGFINFIRSQRDYLLGRRRVSTGTPIISNVYFPGEYIRDGHMVTIIKNVDVK